MWLVSLLTLSMVRAALAAETQHITLTFQVDYRPLDLMT